MPKGKGHDVICPGCRESYHETTRTYNPNRDANAGMLKLKAIYKSYGWDEPVPDPTAGYGILECPNCSAPLAPSGRLEVRERELPPGQLPIEELDKNYPEQEQGFTYYQKDNGKWVCSCNPEREFTRKAHLGSHMRVHKK